MSNKVSISIKFLLVVCLAWILPFQTVSAVVQDTSTILLAESLTIPTVSSVQVGPDLKSVTVEYSQPLSIVAAKITDAAFRDKIKLVTAPDGFTDPTEAALTANDKVALVENKLTVTLATPLSKSLSIVNVKVKAGAVKNAYGTTIQEDLYNFDQSAAPDTEGPLFAYTNEQEYDIVVTPDNKTITVTFDENIFNASNEASATLKATALKNAVTLSSTNMNPVVTVSSVSILGKKMTIKLSNSTNISNNSSIRIAENAIQDLANNKNDEIEFHPGSFQDMTPPHSPVITLLPDMKTFNLKYNEPIFPKTDLAAIKAGINFYPAMGVYPRNKLKSGDTVSIKGDTLTIKLKTPLPRVGFTTSGGFSINEHIADMAGNSTSSGGGYSIPEAPQLESIKVGEDNKSFSYVFEENVFLNDPDSIKDDILKKLSSEENFVKLGANDKVTVKDNVLTVSFPSPLAQTTDFMIEAGVLENAYGVILTDSISTYEVSPDALGPEITNIELSKNRKNVVLTFNESMSINSTASGAPAQLAELKTKIKTKLDDEPAVSLATGDSIKLVGKNQISITFAEGITQDVRIQVMADALKDTLGNKNILTESAALDPEASKPYIESSYLSNGNKTVTLQFSENIFLATGVTPKTLLTKIKVNGTVIPTTTKVTQLPNSLILNFVAPLTIGNNNIVIDPGTVRDEFENVNQ